MNYSVVAAGDACDSLADLTQRVTGTPPGQGEAEYGGRQARGLVVGVDVSAARSARDARAELKRRVIRWTAELRRYPAAIHLLVAYRLPPDVRPGYVLHAADGLALHAHVALERSAARYVDVTLLDVTDCDDSVTLADRILERIAGKAGAYSSVALTWLDIRDTSIARATMADYY